MSSRSLGGSSSTGCRSMELDADTDTDNVEVFLVEILPKVIGL